MSPPLEPPPLEPPPLEPPALELPPKPPSLEPPKPPSLEPPPNWANQKRKGSCEYSSCEASTGLNTTTERKLSVSVTEWTFIIPFISVWCRFLAQVNSVLPQRFCLYCRM